MNSVNSSPKSSDNYWLYESRFKEKIDTINLNLFKMENKMNMKQQNDQKILNSFLNSKTGK